MDFGNIPHEDSKHAWVARWSPNGRYLAIVRGWGYSPHGDFSDLDVLDTLTGKQYIQAFSPDVKGMHFVTDIAWAPDNYHLVAIGQVSAFPHCASKCMEDVNRLYLVDFISGKADLLFPHSNFPATWREPIWHGHQMGQKYWQHVGMEANQGYVLFPFRETKNNGESSWEVGIDFGESGKGLW